MGVDVRSVVHRGWDKGGMQKIAWEGRYRGGKNIRVNTVTKRWHNFANSAQEDVTGSGARMQSAALLTHKLLGVGGMCGWCLCFTSVASGLQKPWGNASLTILLPREILAVSPWRVWFFSSSQHGPELSRKTELIITLGVAFSEFRMGLKTITTWALHQSKWNSHKKAAATLHANENITEIIQYLGFHGSMVEVYVVCSIRWEHILH